MWEYLDRINLDTLGPQLIVGVLAFVAVIFIGATVLFWREQRRKAAAKRLRSTGAPEAPQPVIRESRILRSLERIGNYVSHGRASTGLWEQLIRAGYMGRGATAVYTGAKIVLFAVGITVAVVLVWDMEADMTRKFMLITLGGAVPFFMPNWFVRFQERKRQEEIRQFLPDAVDLLEICVSSGIGLDMAWNMVSAELHHVSPVLGNAMDLSNFEIHLGVSRTQAMRNMSIRTGAESLSSLAAILVQSERFGTSVATALQEFAGWMREERNLTAEEKAEKLPVKLIFPMTLFIFPAILVVATGPAWIALFRALGGM
ncbi:MAG: type II secretion system F family protein [Phycisphaerales bacterium]|nr:MAG: type II secretion system F family protein [Phycisphaerales bacterium]